MKDDKPKLSIFDTFKTKRTQITGEASRQRSIIQHLTDSTTSASKTRTSISQKIAEENGIKWKNIYSGVFRDLDEILIQLQEKNTVNFLQIQRLKKRKLVLKDIITQIRNELEPDSIA